MYSNVWTAYRKLPSFIQALIAALLSFFLNISVAVVLALMVGDFTTSPDESVESTTRTVLGISTKKISPFTDLVRNIFYVVGEMVTKVGNR